MLEQYGWSSPKDAVGRTLIDIAKKSDKICVLSSDVSKSVNIFEFGDCFPERYFEMGIAEQSTVSVAGGLAAEGFIPVYVALSIFSCCMTFPQIRQVCNNSLNVKIIGTHAGVDDGADGPGHHATEDLAISRVIPRLTVLCPSDENEVAAAVKAMVDTYGPVYMRVAREEQPVIHGPDCKFEIGKAEMLCDEGDNFAIVFEGSAMRQALEGWEGLRALGKRGKLVNIRSIKPLDEKLILNLADKVDLIVTVENHSIKGGLYSAICEAIANRECRAVIRPVGFHDQFMDAGASSDIKEKYGLNAASIIKQVTDAH